MPIDTFIRQIVSAIDREREYEVDLRQPDGLAASIYRTRLGAYNETLAREAVKAGYTGPTPALRDRQVLADMAQQAEWTANQVYGTYRTDVIDWLERQPVDATRAQVARDLADYLADRDGWKSVQIASTETSVGAGQAQQDFIRRSGVEGYADFGYSLKCEVCRVIADMNPYPLTDSACGSVPHPNCLDVWTTTYTAVRSPWNGAAA